MSGSKPDREEHALEGTSRPKSGTGGTPRWVIVFGIVIIALIIIFVVLQFVGTGEEHGPGRHAWIDPQVLAAAGIIA